MGLAGPPAVSTSARAACPPPQRAANAFTSRRVALVIAASGASLPACTRPGQSAATTRLWQTAAQSCSTPGSVSRHGTGGFLQLCCLRVRCLPSQALLFNRCAAWMPTKFAKGTRFALHASCHQQVAAQQHQIHAHVSAHAGCVCCSASRAKKQLCSLLEGCRSCSACSKYLPAQRPGAG